jgi:hypothetical protein
MLAVKHRFLSAAVFEALLQLTHKQSEYGLEAATITNATAFRQLVFNHDVWCSAPSGLSGCVLLDFLSYRSAY